MDLIENESKEECDYSGNSREDFGSENSHISDIEENLINKVIKSEEEVESNFYNESCNNEEIHSDDYPQPNDQVICVELMNNNKIYVNYESTWTLRDLMNTVLGKKEIKELYNCRDYFLNNKFMSSVFDFKLNIYRSLKDKDDKIDLNIRIKDLETLGFLKSTRFPFLCLHDSRNFNNISQNKFFLKTVYENSIKNENYKVLIHQDLIYRDYLPRCYVSYLPSNNSFLDTDLYNLSKRCLNHFNKIELDPIICNGNSDWFVYNDESLNFLIKMSNSEFHIDNNIKVINDKVYFQDKLPYISLSSKETKQFFINVILNTEIKMKIDVGLNSNGKEIMRKVNQKLKISYPHLVFDAEVKIFKVLGLSDYIIDLEEPLGLFSYINQCIKNNTIPEYIIINSPYLNDEDKPGDSNNTSNRSKMGSIKKRRSSSLSQLENFQKINSDANQKQNQNFLNSRVNLQDARKIGSVVPNPFTKTSDKKLTPLTQGNTFLNKPANDAIKVKTNLPLSNTNSLLNYDKKVEPVVITINEKKTISNLNEKRFDNIAVFNESIIQFSELKGIRRRNPIEKSNKKDLQAEHPVETDLNVSYIDNIIQKSVEHKLKVENEKTH